MRSIKKGAEPEALRLWKQDMASSPQNLSYGNLPTNIKDEIKQSLLYEQGHLCAYTLRRLSKVDDCHIEHVIPQSDELQGVRQELDFNNLAACFPCNGGDTSGGYGAPVKAGTAVRLNLDFVSPHSPGCEQRFIFDAQGGVTARRDDAAAQATIRTLRLDHPALIDLRRSALQAHGLTLARRTTRAIRQPKSAAEARRFAAQVLLLNVGEELEPFCVALAQVAITYAEKEESRARRIRAQR